MGTEEQAERQSGGENRGVDEDVQRQGGEGQGSAQSTPPIDQEGEQGQTEHSPGSGDVGVGSDEEISREG
jgi:hypothetical protein